jgi:peroxiredoxin
VRGEEEDTMAMQIGSAVPDVTLKVVREAGNHEEVSTKALFEGKKVVIFGLPGAYTPTCSAKHLPGYVAKLEDLKAKGVDLVACLSVNDAFVMEAWAKEHGALGKITMIADGSAAFTKAAGLELDLTGAGMGLRCKRWAAVFDNGVVKSLDVDAQGLVETACEVQLGKV